MTLLTQSLTFIQKGLGSSSADVIKCLWITVIICFGLSGLFGLKLSGDVRDIVKKRMEEEREEEDLPRKQLKRRTYETDEYGSIEPDSTDST